MDEVDAVTEEISAPSETTNPSGEGIVPAGAPPSEASQAARDNPIPYSRVKEMQAKWEAQHKAEIAKRDQEVSQYREFLRNSQTGILKAFGLHQEAKPEYVDAASMQKQLESLKSEFRETLEQRELRAQANLGWKEVSTKHSKWARFPGFRDAVLNTWGQDISVDMAEVGDKVAAEYDKLVAGFQAQANQEYAEKKASAPKVVKSGGGTGATSSKDEKVPMKAAIKRMLRGED